MACFRTSLKQWALTFRMPRLCQHLRWDLRAVTRPDHSSCVRPTLSVRQMPLTGGRTLTVGRTHGEWSGHANALRSQRRCRQSLDVQNVSVHCLSEVRTHAVHCWQAWTEPTLGREHTPNQAAALAGGGKQRADRRCWWRLPIALPPPTSFGPPSGALYLELSNAYSMWWVATAAAAAPKTTTCAIATTTR